MSEDKLQLQIAPPTSCPICGITIEQMEEQYRVKWLLYELQGTTFILFQCPNCSVMCGNVHAVENSKILAERQKEMENRSPILKPNKNLIILPGKGNVSKN